MEESSGCMSIFGAIIVLTLVFAIIVSIPVWFWILLGVIIVAATLGAFYYYYKKAHPRAHAIRKQVIVENATVAPKNTFIKETPETDYMEEPETVEISHNLRAPEVWTINDLTESIKANDPEIHITIDKENRLLQLSYAHAQLQRQLENDERLLGSLLNSTIDLSNALQKNGVRDLTIQILSTWYGDPIISVFNGVTTQMDVNPNKYLENPQQFGETTWNKPEVPFFSEKVKLLDSMKDVDKLDGRGFELFIGELLRSTGYENVEVTITSGDQGVDVIAEHNHKKIGIQCKHFKGTVGNKAVQELFAGIAFYHLDKGIVVTNSTFTQSAVELAKATSIDLWDRTKLSHLIADCPNTEDTESTKF